MASYEQIYTPNKPTMHAFKKVSTGMCVCMFLEHLIPHHFNGFHLTRRSVLAYGLHVDPYVHQSFLALSNVLANTVNCFYGRAPSVC